MKRFRLASALNIIGLATALTACYVLWTQVEFARNFNKCIPGWENVYRLEEKMASDDKWMNTHPRPLIEQLAEMPEVEEYFCGQLYAERIRFVKKGEETIKVEDAVAFDQGLRLARPRMLCGVDTLTNKYDVLIPRSFADMYFGEVMVTGRDIEFSDGKLHVVGVFEDFPQGCIFPNCLYVHYGDECKDSMESWYCHSFFRLRPGCDKKNVEQRAWTIMTDYNREIADAKSDTSEETNKQLEEWCNNLKFSLRNSSETYFSGVSDYCDRGDKGMDLVLRLAMIFLLAVATINFANFTLAGTPMKIRGINTRKVLGMTDFQLRRDFILETVTAAMTAFALAVGLIWTVSLWPWMQNLVVSSVAIKDNLHLIIYLGLTALVIGVLVGIYPAFYATSFKPALVLKGSFGLSPRGIMLRKTLVSVQLFVAFFLTIYLGVLFLQRNFIYNSDYGFDKDEILYCTRAGYKEDMDKIRQRIKDIPGVESVGFTNHMPGFSMNSMIWGRDVGEKKVQLAVLPVDCNFLTTIGIGIVEGRNFTEHDCDCLIVNEAAKKEYDWIEIDKPFADGMEPVIGVCNDFRVYSTKNDNCNIPVVFIVFGKKYEGWTIPYTVAVRVGKNIDKIGTKKKLEAALKNVVDVPEFKFLDDDLQTAYEEEFRFIRQVEAFSLICLLITLVGVFCLTVFETEYRRKEIGLRKIMGNSTRDIILMFCRRYASLIAIAFVFAAPLSYYMAVQWLQNFAERTPVHWWLWPAGFATVSLVVLLTVAAQTWRTARENPINSIKTE